MNSSHLSSRCHDRITQIHVGDIKERTKKTGTKGVRAGYFPLREPSLELSNVLCGTPLDARTSGSEGVGTQKANLFCRGVVNVNARCIAATGIGKSLEPAQLLQHLLRKTKTFVHVPTLDVVREFSDLMAENSLLIVFSVSARAEVMDRVRNCGGKVLLVTTNVAHAYQDVVDRTVVLPFLPPDPETCPVSPVLFDVFVELLVSYITNAVSQ